ncbi:hypothetical protein COOONC_12305, partial [Cooperia oncophora]
TSNCEQQLVEDYQRLFRDDLLTDFTIRVGGREIRAHRAILAARSVPGSDNGERNYRSAGDSATITVSIDPFAIILRIQT